MAVRLYHGDCLEIMKGLLDASVDAVIADPPYGTTQAPWDSVIPFVPMWEHLRRVTRPNAAIVLFAAQPFTSALVMSNPREFRYEWTWDKANPSGHLNAKRRPLHRHEHIEVFSQGQPPYYPQMRTGVLRRKGSLKQDSDCYGAQRGSVTISDQYYPTSILPFSNAHKAVKRHPNEKPVALLAYLIRTYTRPGDVVLDFCFGSGNSGVAALNEGREYIGIERDPGYYAAAVPYIAAAQSPLFAEVAD